MLIKINPQTKITMLLPGFVSIINELLKNTSLDSSEIVALNFRDPTYSATNGGYHPVEIHAIPRVRFSASRTSPTSACLLSWNSA